MAKILLVDDDENSRDMLSRRLIRRGFEVVVAIDGKQGAFFREDDLGSRPFALAYGRPSPGRAAASHSLQSLGASVASSARALLLGRRAYRTGRSRWPCLLAGIKPSARCAPI
jgi:hypothetical protein